MRNCKYFFIFLFFVVGGIKEAISQTVLTTGDIAFVGYCSEVNSVATDDAFSFMLLKDITTGTKITFTDGRYNDATGYFSLVANSEWVFEWQATTGMSVGDIVTMKSGGNGTTNITVSSGSLLSGRGMNLPTSGDQLFAVYGGTIDTVSTLTFTPGTVLAGIHMNYISGTTTTANWDVGAAVGSASELPNTLTNGVDAIWAYAAGPVEQDNAVYKGSLLGTATELRARINDLSNWELIDAVGYTLPDDIGDGAATAAPTVTTTTASPIQSTTATSGGEVTSDGGDAVTAYGVCWSTSANPTIADNISTDGTGTGVFASSIIALLPNTLYYYRAYATNSIGTSYGAELSFTTSALPSIAEECAQIEKIVATDRAAGDNYGYNISISGTYAVVGAPFQELDELGANSMNNAGAAYILKQTNGIWEEVQKIVSSDRAAGDNFGYRVAIDGNYIVIGAWAEDEDANGANTLGNAGSAYVFKNNAGTWTQMTKLVSSDRRAADNYGVSVDIDGDYIAIGAHLSDYDGGNLNFVSSSGAVYIYKNDGNAWIEMQKIVPTDRSTQDYFGLPVAISGDYIVAGARQEGTEAFGVGPGAARTTPLEGAAYVFQNIAGTWTEMQKLTAPTRGETDLFGFAVAIDGDVIAIGAHQEDEDASEANTISNSGSVYVFENFSDTWKYTQKIVASDRADSDQFGRDIAVDGDHIAVGSWQDDEDENGANTLSNAGSAYFFEKNSGAWVQTRKVVANDRAIDDNFGYKVAIDGNEAIVTAYLEDEDENDANNLANAGSIYSFSLIPQVSSVDVPSANSYYSTENLDFTVNFTHAITVTGTPSIALTIGSSSVNASYVSGTGTDALVFRYTVQNGDQDLDGIAVGTMALNGGTLVNGANNALIVLNNVGSTTLVLVNPSTTFVSAATDAWTTTTTWVGNVVPGSTNDVQILNGHNVTISANTTVNDLYLENGSTITLTGTAILTIDGDLYDQGGSFSAASTAQIIVVGDVKNSGTSSGMINTSTNGLLIKGNIDIE